MIIMGCKRTTPGGDIDLILKQAASSSGSSEKTGVAMGKYNASYAGLMQTYTTNMKIGPMFEVYDPGLASLMSMEF